MYKFVKIILTLIIVSSYSISFSQSDSVADSLNEIYKKAKGEEKYEILTQLWEHYYNECPEKSIPYLEKTIEYTRAKHLYKETANMLHNLGFAHYKITNYNAAIYHYKQSVKIKKNFDDNESIANTYNNIGLVYFDWSEYEQALIYYQKALEIIGKDNPCKMQATIFNNIGLVYLDWNDIDLALKYFNQALKIRENLFEKFGIASSLNNIGNAYYKLGNYNKALDNYKQSLKIKEEIGHKRGIANSLNNIGLIYLEIDNYNESINYLEQSLEIKKELNYKKGIANTFNNLGRVYIKLNNFERAIEYFNNSIEISKHLQLTSSLIESYQYLANAYELKKDDNNALIYYKKYFTTHDSIYNSSTRIKIIEIQTKYETQQREREIELLRIDKELKDLKLKKSQSQYKFLLIILILVIIFMIVLYLQYALKKRTNKLLAEKNEQLLKTNQKLEISENKLKELNVSKDKLFSIISHDLHSSFNVLLGFTEILAKKFKTIDEIKRQEYNQLIYKSSRQLFNLLDNLLKWSRTQSKVFNNNPEVIDITNIIVETTSALQINTEEKNIKININMDNNTYVYLDKNLIKTVIRNLLLNAIKFSYKHGEIDITSQNINKDIIINFKDYGTGIDNKDIKNLFKIDNITSTKGTMNEEGTGFGLVLCKEIIDIIGGKIKVESIKEKGSIFSIILPTKI